MDSLALKKEVLQVSKKHQQAVIDNLRENIDRYQEGEAQINDEEFDLQEQSYSGFTYTIINRLADNLNMANHGLDDLNKIKVIDQHKEISFGSLVLTNKRNFLIATAIEPFKVQDMDVVGISQNSMLYQKMKGLKKGDQFQHNGIEYEIKDVI
jgi:hypothetical protein